MKTKKQDPAGSNRAQKRKRSSNFTLPVRPTEGDLVKDRLFSKLRRDFARAKRFDPNLLGRNSWSDASICSDCVDDRGLKEFIDRNLDSTECTFCQKTAEKPIATGMTNLSDYVLKCLETEYDDADDCLPWEGAEGGYQGVTKYTHEVIQDELNVLLDAGDPVIAALSSLIKDRTWCERNPFSLSERERLVFSWKEFCDLIKFKRRFFFLQPDIVSSDDEEDDLQRDNAVNLDGEDDDLLRPAELLKKLQNPPKKLGLVVNMTIGTTLFRARVQEANQKLRSASDLGPPQREFATTSNRMSPAGVVMIYLSEDPATAVLETADVSGTYVIGKFTAARELRVLDLSRIPATPSIFQSDLRDNRPTLHFLNEFEADFSKPIDRNGREHVDYVPTQVVTEYFRSMFKSRRGPIDGMRYPSAARRGGTSLVLFGDQDNVAATLEPNGQYRPEILIAFSGIYRTVRFGRTRRVARSGKKSTTKNRRMKQKRTK